MPQGKRLTSIVTSESTVKLTLEEFEIPSPAPDEVLMEVQASPINPSDLGLLLAGADASTASVRVEFGKLIEILIGFWLEKGGPGSLNSLKKCLF